MEGSELGRVLVVCTGNVCRSPFIERVLRSALAVDGGEGSLQVSSAGTRALAGAPMDERAAAQAIKHGATVTGFVARQLEPQFVAESDLVLTATRKHRGEVAAMHPKALRYCFTFADFADLVSGVDAVALALDGSPRERFTALVEAAAARRGLTPPLTSDEADIVDPYRRGDEVFVEMAQQVMRVLPAIVRAMVGAR